MGKHSGILILTTLTAIAGAGFFIGNGIYGKTIRKKEATAPSSNREEAALRASRAYFASHPNSKDMNVDSIDFLHLRGVLLEQEGGSSDYCLLLHAEHSDHTSVGLYAKHYYEKGFNVLAPDLRGCGSSDGNYMGFGYDDRLDVMAWVYRILKLNDHARIVIHGLGSGASAALLASAEHLPDAVDCIISDTAFTDGTAFFGHFIKYGTPDILPVRLKFLLFRIVTRIRAGFDPAAVRPIDAVKLSRTPTLFLHADDDVLVPVRMCNELYTAATCAREYGTFLNATHFNAMTSNPAQYWKRVDAFIEKSHRDQSVV